MSLIASRTEVLPREPIFLSWTSAHAHPTLWLAFSLCLEVFRLTNSLEISVTFILLFFLQSFRTHYMECMKTTGLKVLVYVDLCPWAICNDYSFSQGGPVHCLSGWEAGMRWKPERHLAQCPCRKWQWFLSYCCGLTEPTNFQPSI